MTKSGGIEHQRAVNAYAEELQGQGWRVIQLQGKSPDAIAVKDGQVCAVEVVTKSRRRPKSGHSRGWRLAGGFTLTQKRHVYSMFDDVLFRVIASHPRRGS